MGTNPEAGDPHIGETGVIQHEAEWLQVIALIDRLMKLHAKPNSTNQTNLELPKWCKEECLQLARRLGLIASEGSVGINKSRAAVLALQASTVTPHGVGPADTGGAASGSGSADPSAGGSNAPPPGY